VSAVNTPLKISAREIQEAVSSTSKVTVVNIHSHFKLCFFE